MKTKPFARITVADIASWMALSPKEVWLFARNIDRHFKPTQKRVCRGKVREITPPKRVAREALRRLHDGLQRNIRVHGCAHGGVKDHSIFTSARNHLGKKNVWTRDLKDCFPSISSEMIRSELNLLGFRPKVARLLSMLFTVRGVVAQGSPVSTDAVNLYLFRLDQFMASEAGKSGLTYSRIVDDVVVSGASKQAGDALIRRFEDEVRSWGMRINEKKRREAGLQCRPLPQHVHNLRVDLKPGVRASKVHTANATDTATRYVDACRRVTPESIVALAHLRRRLIGHINFLAQSHASRVKHLRGEVRIGDRLVKSRLAANRLTAHKGCWWTISKKRNEPRRLADLWNTRLSKELHAVG